MLDGASITLELTAVGLGMGVVRGLLAGMGRVYGSRPVRWLSIAHIELVRGTLLLVQLFLIYYGLPGLDAEGKRARKINFNWLNAARTRCIQPI